MSTELLADIQDSIDGLKAKSVPVGTLTDGYHSFNELYRHRITLYKALCKMFSKNILKTVWMSKKQSDGAEIAGWFLLGINTKPGTQITYHIPMSDWDECKAFAQERRQAPDYDGHTSADVLTRLAEL